MTSTTSTSSALDFTKPHVVSPLQVAFPANVIGVLMPSYKDIPVKYPGKVFFEHLQNRWFYFGLKTHDLPPTKPEIDLETAVRHLQCIQGSFQPKHEHKIAAVAWLMSLWFELPANATSPGSQAGKA